MPVATPRSPAHGIDLEPARRGDTPAIDARDVEPGDTVALAVERLGVLRTPIVARPG